MSPDFTFVWLKDCDPIIGKDVEHIPNTQALKRDKEEGVVFFWYVSVAARTSFKNTSSSPDKQNLPYVKVGHLDAVGAFTKSNFMSQQGLQGVKRYRHIQKCIALVAVIELK